MTFPAYSSFCCLALKGPSLSVPGTHTVIPGVTVSNTQDELVLEPHWEQWLGTIQTNNFRESSLYITAVVETDFRTGEMPHHEFLDRRVRLLHHAFSLLGCGFNSDVLMVGGDSNNGTTRIGPIRSGLTPCFRFPTRKSRGIEVADIQRAAAILPNLETIYSHFSDRMYRRLRKGFNVWIRGVEEGEAINERFHSHFRAIEAILKPTIAKRRKKSKGKKGGWRDITSTFVERGKHLLSDSRSNEKLLRQFFNIRSSIEHTKDVDPVVRKPRGIDPRESFMFRALQCEILVGEIYTRILTSAELLRAFSTETRIEGFWRLAGHKRQALWGERIDIEAEARRQFFSYIPPDSW